MAIGYWPNHKQRINWREAKYILDRALAGPVLFRNSTGHGRGVSAVIGP
jgi:hypothetical protein